jgi:hypothetical protein
MKGLKKAMVSARCRAGRRDVASADMRPRGQATGMHGLAAVLRTITPRTCS